MSGKGNRLVKWSLVALSMALVPLASVPVLAQTTGASSAPPDECSATHDQYQQPACPPPAGPPPDPPTTFPPETDPAPTDPAPTEPPLPPAITVEKVGKVALEESLTAFEALNDGRNDGARELEEDDALAAEKPSAAHSATTSGIVSHPAEVQAVGLSEKEAALLAELDTGTENDSTRDVAAAVDGGEVGASREEELAPEPKDRPPTMTMEAIDPIEGEAASRPAEALAALQAVALRSVETVRLLDLPPTLPALLASALVVVAAGLLIRRSMR